jgi:hypothetical protein
VSSDDESTIRSQKKTIKESISDTTTAESSPSNFREEKVVVATPTNAEYKRYEVKPSPEEESLSARARDVGQSLRDLVTYMGRKAKAMTEQKTTDLKAQAAQTADLDIKKDARDIQNLGSNIDNIINVFEDIMTDIRKERYGEQQRLLVGYKKLLEEQINVIDARLKMAKRLRLTSV